MASTPADSRDGVARREIGRILQRQEAIARQRLERIQKGLGHDQNRFIGLLPLLLHINHLNLPGFCGEQTPAGIAGYVPDRDAILHARHYARTLKDSFAPPRLMPIQGFYLIGSSGTLGQDRHSDFDFWVCHHPDLSASQLKSLRKKLDLLEQHAEALGLQCHFFLLHAAGFRGGEHLEISDESSGDTQHHLLLEEFYRSGLLIAGKPPLWWLAPPSQVDDYTAWSKRLLSQRFVRPQDWLEFGGLSEIGVREFFSAAHWQLYKGIGLPYKSLLKLILFEAYAADYPHIPWISSEAKALIHAEDPVDADTVDAYWLMMQRVEHHLLKQNEPQRLALARRAFYIKSGVSLSQASHDDWKQARIRRLTKAWGWDRGDLLNLDSHRHWKLSRVMEERNLLVAELSRSYRQLTDFARRHAAEDMLDSDDLALLGRKLQAALERRPGKIDCVNPGISQDLSEDTVWLRYTQSQDTWQLFVNPPCPDDPPMRTTRGLVEMLTWLVVNRVIGRHTRIDLPQLPGAVPQEHLRLLKLLRSLLRRHRDRPVPLQNFDNPAQARLSIVFVNVSDHQDAFTTAPGDPLNAGPSQQNTVRRVDHLQGNNWGELQVDHHTGPEALSDALCAHLDQCLETPEEVPFEVHCQSPGLGISIASRVRTLAATATQHFRDHDDRARFLFALGGAFVLLERRRGLHGHRTLGDQRALLEYLAVASDHFRPTSVDPASMPDSALPFVLQHCRDGHVQVCYRVQRGGISLFVVDHTGALHQQWLPEATEPHLLIQLQRFFDTLRTWRQVLPPATPDGANPIHFVRLGGSPGQWRSEQVTPPTIDNRYTELVLITGRRGPWKDGFSLISGSREFNSLQLGDAVYQQVVDYVLGLRRGNASYPLYLTGATVADDPFGNALTLVELLGFKRLVEKRLAEAMTQARRE